MNVRPWSVRLGALAVLLAALTTPVVAQKLTGAGATFPYPVYTKWFDAYYKETGVQINYQSIGSGGGIRQFTEGTVDFGATDGPMSDDQIEAVSGNVVHIPTVIGAVVLTYNLPSLGADQAPARRPDARRHLPRPDHQVERPAHRRAQPRRRAPQAGPDRGAPLRRLGHDLHLHRLPHQGLAGVEDKVGLATSVNWPVGPRRQGQRRGRPSRSSRSKARSATSS